MRDLFLKALGENLLDVREELGEWILLVPRTRLIEAMTALKETPELAFAQLMDLCGADYPSRVERFEVVYNLLSLDHNHRVRVKILTDETSPVPSLVALYKTAGWFEREAAELFGIGFTGNDDLRRLLTEDDFAGYPLRKDFPLTGFLEVRYDEEERAVIHEPVNLTQDYRDFDAVSPWDMILKEEEPSHE